MKQTNLILIAVSSLWFATTSTAAVVSHVETFDTGIQDWSTTLSSSSSGAALGAVATGGEDGGAYISQTGDVTFGAFGPVGVVFRCNNTSGLNCSGGNLFGNFDPASNDTSLSFHLRHNAGVNLDFFVRIAPLSNSPGAGTGSGAPAFNSTVTSNTWTELTLDIDSNYFDSFSGTDFDTVFSNLIERIQIGVSLPFNPATQGFDPLIGVTYDLDTVSIATTPVPVPAAAWLFGSSLFGLFAVRRKTVNT